MKLRKFFSGVFAVLGTVLMVGTIVLSFASMKAEPRIVEQPEAAEQLAQSVMDALCNGEYDTAAGMMYGQPQLGADREPSDEVGALIWDAYVNSLSYEFSGEYYATDSGIARNAVVTALDTASVTASLEERARTLLEAQAAAAEDPSEVYDEDNNFRKELVEQALLDAVQQALNEAAQTKTWEVTLNLIQMDGQWWVMPDAALLQAISGGAA